MKLQLLIPLALRGLRYHKMRSTLSALGIVFGVAAVIAMLSVSEGVRREILLVIGRLGVTRVSVRASSASQATELDTQGLQSPGLTLADANAIGEILPSIASLAPLRESSEQLVRNGLNSEASIVATTPSYGSTEELLVKDGRFLTGIDLNMAQRVVVLGHGLEEALFPYSSAIGKKIRIGVDWYEVVGALAFREQSRRSSSLSGRDINQAAFIPISCIPKSGGRIDEIAIRIDNAIAVSDSARVIRSIVARRHRGANDFEMFVPQALIAGYERARFQFNVVVGAVAVISLIVGGIGIMNIMLANVTERIREVGIRRSLGATRADIGQQFLMEAMMLTSGGGVAGILLGIFASYVVSNYADWPTVISAWAIIFAMLLAVTTGVAFGFYPAVKSSRKQPVEALRHHQ